MKKLKKKICVVYAMEKEHLQQQHFVDIYFVGIAFIDHYKLNKNAHNVESIVNHRN